MPQDITWEDEYRDPQLLVTKGDQPQKDVLRFFKFLRRKEGISLENLAVLDLGSGTGQECQLFGRTWK